MSQARAPQWLYLHKGRMLGVLGKCVDARATSMPIGPLSSYSCTGGNAQRWFQRPDGQIENPASGRCLSTQNAADADGTRLVLFDCQYAPNQRWSVDFD